MCYYNKPSLRVYYYESVIIVNGIIYNNMPDLILIRMTVTKNNNSS